MPQTTDDILGPPKAPTPQVYLSMKGVESHKGADITTDDILGPATTDDILGPPRAEASATAPTGADVSEAVARQATQKAEQEREEPLPTYPPVEELQRIVGHGLGAGERFVQQPGVKLMTPQGEKAVRSAYGEIPGGAVAGAGEFLQGLTSPMSMATMGALGGASPQVAKAANFIFSAQMMNSIGKASPELAASIQQGRWGDAAKMATTMGLSGLMTILMVKEAMKQPPQMVRTPDGDLVQPNAPVHPLLEGEVQAKLQRMGADIHDPQSVADVVAASKGISAPPVKTGDVPVSQTGEGGAVTIPDSAAATAVVHEVMHREAAANPEAAAPPEGNQDATAIRFLAQEPETPAVKPEDAKLAFPSISDSVNITKGLRSENHAIEALQAVRAEAALRDDMRTVDKLPEDQQLALYNQAERDPGQIADPRLRQTALAVQGMIRDRWTRIQQLRGADDFIENYLPHIFEDPDAARQFFISRRPLRGNTGFLLPRVHDTVMDAIAAGNKLLTPNLVKSGLLRMAQLDKYEQALLFEKNSKALGTMKFVRTMDDAPQGWVKTPDPIGTVIYRGEDGARSIAGYNVMPAEAAKILARDLSPGIANRGGFLGNTFDAYRQANAAVNSAQLGLSLFHVGMTTGNAAIIDVIHGMNQLQQGDLGGLLSIGRGMVPGASAFRNVAKGIAFKRQLIGDGPLTGDLMSFVEGGSRVKMDSFYAATARNLLEKSWKQAWESGDIDVKMRQLPGQLIRSTMWPVMEWFVPLQKMAATRMLMQDELARLGPAASDPVQRRFALSKAQQLVDNAMGQVVYDNWFWNRSAVQIMQATIRSLGWTGGSLKLFGGAARDVGALPGKVYQKATGVNGPNALADPMLTLNIKYVMGLAAVQALWGSLLGGLLMRAKGHSGWVPQSVKDVLNPPSGSVQPDGSMARVSLPLYTKDLSALAYQGPQKTVMNKLAPLGSDLGQIWNNRDFYGTQIRNEDDPIYQQGLDVLRYLAGSSKPFALQGVQQAEKQGFTGPLKYASEVGVTPSPRYINESPMQAVMSKYEELSRSELPRTKEAAARTKAVSDIERIWRQKGAPAGTIAMNEARQKGELAATDIHKIILATRRTPNQARFGRLPIDWQLKALNAASPQERAEVQSLYARSHARINLTKNEAERKQIEDRARAGLE